MYIVDSHCDSLQNVDDHKYGLVNPYNYSRNYRQLQFVAVFCVCPGSDAKASNEKAVRHIGHFAISMQSEKDKVVQVKTYGDIERAFSEGKHAALLTFEGGTGILGSKKIFRDFYNIGVRVFGLAWLSNDLAKSNRLEAGEEDPGLTDVGRDIVKEGNSLGMIFDVSHLSDKSFWDVAECSKKPIIATHSNFRAICDHSRNLTDDMAREIIRQDGMIGLNLYPDFIDENEDKKTVEGLFRHLDHCLELGGEDHIGFGCDIDGVDGRYPYPINTDSSIHDQLIELMLGHNYRENIINKVAFENYMNFLKKYL